jgi:hypothetical protein
MVRQVPGAPTWLPLPCACRYAWLCGPARILRKCSRGTSKLPEKPRRDWTVMAMASMFTNTEPHTYYCELSERYRGRVPLGSFWV